IDGFDGLVDEWHYASLEGERGLRADALNSHRAGRTHDSVSEAVRHLQERAMPGDRVVVFGSFHTVGQALPLLQETAHGN
ncbi:MAG: bifunctional folylpolyglutamate synthase/dihydrofolate synthase, partial [Gammaproteobacteria bacterium]